MRKKIPLIGGIINLIESLKGDIGIIENTDVATHSISAGSYVIWHNELYKASSAIAVDDALSSSNLTAVSGGVGNELNNKFVQLLAPTAYSNNNDAQLSESIENYDELYIELYINTSTGFRSASHLIPVSAIKNNGYGISNQYIVNAVGTANITSDKIAYVIFAQIAFKNAQTINMASSGYNGWSGTLYISIYAK